jgi:5-methylcytosine-specific restriction protein B
MHFTLTGQQYQLSKEEVERTMGGVEPSRGRHYFVVVNGQAYPPNQVLYLTLRRQHPGLSLADFSNDTAKNILSQIGFELVMEGGV